MSLLQRVMLKLVEELVQQEQLELEPGADPGELAEELLAHLRSAPNHAHVGAAVCQVLIASPRVAEVYVEDHVIIDLLNNHYT
jgi:hypothetical protein